MHANDAAAFLFFLFFRNLRGEAGNGIFSFVVSAYLLVSTSRLLGAVIYYVPGMPHPIPATASTATEHHTWYKIL